MLRVNPPDIHYIYDMFVKPYAKQLGKYEEFDRFVETHNNKKWKWEDKDFPRVIALLEFAHYIQKHRIAVNSAVSFNGANDPEWEYLPHNNAIDYNYDKNTGENDLQTWNPPIYNYDFALLNQTLEHVVDPILCLQNIHKHLNKRGYIWITVPVLSIPHEIPLHYYTGYTPTGLGCITYSAGFEIIELGYWGNKEYLDLMFDEGWVDYTKLSVPLKNISKFSVITWVLARKL